MIICLDIGSGKKDSPVVATQLVVPTQLSEVSYTPLYSCYTASCSCSTI